MSTIRGFGWTTFCAWALGMALFLSMGCSSTKLVTVDIPPRVNLAGIQPVGIIDFTCAANKELAPKATQRFVQRIQSAQPGVPILELGSREQLLAGLGKSRLDAEAVRAIKEKTGVGAILSGDLNVSDIKPQFRVTSVSLKGISAKAKINGELVVKLWDAGSGALAWTGSDRGEWTIGHASLRGMGVSDPEEKYNEMIDYLVGSTSHDFCPRQGTKRVPK